MQNLAQIHKEEEGKEKVQLPVPRTLSPSQKKRLNWLASIKKGQYSNITTK